MQAPSEKSHRSEDSKEHDELLTDKLEVFDPKEYCNSVDGWELYKKSKFNVQPVRRYIHLLDKDYSKNKITVSVNLSNLFNSYMVGRYYCKNKQIPANLNNYFDYEKWCSQYELPPDSQS